MFSAGAFAKFMEYFMAIPNYLENFFTSNPNLMFGSNIWVMLLGLGASVLYGVSFGRAKAVISLISLYIASKGCFRILTKSKAGSVVLGRVTLSGSDYF